MIDAGKLINEQIRSITGVTTTGIFPEIAPENTVLPYIVYEVENNYINTKDGIVGNNAVVTLNLYTKLYISGVEMSDLIVNSLNQNSRYTSGNTVVRLTATADNPTFSGEYYQTQITVITRLY